MTYLKVQSVPIPESYYPKIQIMGQLETTLKARSNPVSTSISDVTLYLRGTYHYLSEFINEDLDLGNLLAYKS